jgi:hypothetical protein
MILVIFISSYLQPECSCVSGKKDKLLFGFGVQPLIIVAKLASHFPEKSYAYIMIHFIIPNPLNWMPWRGVVRLEVSSPPATEETGAMGRKIESRQGIGWQLFEKPLNRPAYILNLKLANKIGSKFCSTAFEANLGLRRQVDECSLSSF